MEIEPAEAQTTEVENKVESSLVSSVAQEASNNDTEPPSEPRRNQPYYFSSKQINSCIMASEGTRFFCSVTIAILVVQSYTGFPILNRKSIIAWRPLYMLLLTEITIVLGLLLLEKRRGAEASEGEDLRASQNDGQTWTGAIKVLERGLVVHQTIRAIFIDCSVYLVIVICGQSLIRV